MATSAAVKLRNHLNRFRSLSIKARVTLFTLLIFVLSIWSLALYASWMLREDLQGVLGEQQRAVVSFMAAEVDREIKDLVWTLEVNASAVDPTVFVTPGGAQQYFQTRTILQSHFNSGVFALSRDGTAVADAPLPATRLGVNYMEDDAIADALTQGKSTIGTPHRTEGTASPEFEIVTPIRDRQGRVIGALAGVTRMAKPSFVDVILDGPYGKLGGYFFLIAAGPRLILASSAGSRATEPPPAGVDPLSDRFMQGYEGSGVALNPLGVEVLASAKGIPAASWHIVAALPTAQAFAPIRALQQRVLLATLFLTLAAGGLTWWMVRRQLSPMLVAAKALARLTDTSQTPQPLAIGQQDEIGQLISGFNRLLQTLSQRDLALRESEERYRTAFISSPDAIILSRLVDGLFLDVNDSFLRLTGWTREEVIGQTTREINVWHRQDDRLRLVSALKRDGYCESLESDFVTKDGRVLTALMSAHVLAVNREPCILSITRDITERKSAENQIRKLSLAVEQSSESIVITNIAAEIEYVNDAFVKNTGYSREEAIGKNPRLLQSGHTPRATYASLWDSLTQGKGWRGEFHNQRKDGSEYVELANVNPIRQSDGCITHYVAVKEDITDRKRAQGQINSLAFYDTLTNLPNRRLLIDRLKQALAASSRHQREGALLFIDMDNFKDLNDTLGHDKGDLLLQQVSDRVSSCMREGDTVARLGGDEFVVILEDLNVHPTVAANQVELVGEKILEVLRQPYRLAGCEYHCSASIGVTLFSNHEETVEELLRGADLAMYQAKSGGRNMLRFFDPAMQASVNARATLELDLRKAFAEQQFSLYYQPQVMGKNQITGAESLLRWHHPERGLVSPGDFIPLAESTGLILPLGKWVLETACTQLVRWASQSEMQDFTVAVNVSARQFHHRNFVAEVIDVLERTGANPRRLKLELTESLLVSNLDDVIVKMTTLKEHGVGFSLDDFGTGFSSLSYLKRLPLDQLKVDQSFVRDILIDHNDAAISQMVITLAASLGLSVIAEGVETGEQRDFLAGQGCHAYQGFLFSRPLPLEAFEALATRVM